MMMMTRFNVLAVVSLVALLGGTQLLGAQELPVSPTPQPSGGLISNLIHHTVVQPIKSTYQTFKEFFNENKSDIKEAFDSIREKAFESFMRMYNKSYSGEELRRRLELYSKRLTMIQEWNKQYQEGKVTYSLKANQFSDITDEEWRHMNGLSKRREGFLVDSDDEIYNNNNNETSDNLTASSTNYKTYYGGNRSPSYNQNEILPVFVDWRTSGCLSRVKDQGSCGSCYAFATVDAVSASRCIHWGEPAENLSAQQIVDCANVGRIFGCEGGWPDHVMRWLHNKDIARERDYPYMMIERSCKYNDLVKRGVLLKTGESHISPKFEEIWTDSKFKYHLAKTGPIIITMYASYNFLYYGGGFFDDKTCGQERLNHAVLLVGYGRERGQDYWLIRNSHGDDWGESGYMKIKAGQCQVGKQGWVILKD